MNEELTKKYVDEQYQNIFSFGAIIEHYEWQIERDNLDIYVSMRPKKHKEMQFMVRLRCNDYPQHSPSLQFVDPTSNQTGCQYWPQVGPFKAAINRDKTQPQFCIPGIREFHEGCHAGDTSRPWVPDKYPFIIILENTQTLLDLHLR